MFLLFVHSRVVLSITCVCIGYKQRIGLVGWHISALFLKATLSALTSVTLESAVGTVLSAVSLSLSLFSALSLFLR